MVVNSDGGSLYLLNIIDKKNPLIVSKLNLSNEDCFCSCILDDLSYSIIGSSKGIRILPLKSKVLIHSEINRKN